MFCVENSKAGCKQGRNEKGDGVYTSWGPCKTTRSYLSHCMRNTKTKTGTPYHYVCLEDEGSNCDGWGGVCGKEDFTEIDLS